MEKLLVFEGIDGVGKTNIGKLLAEKIGAEFIDTPSEPYKKNAYMLNGSEQARFFYYLSANADISNRVSKILSHKPVVLARYFDSTIVDYSAKTETPMFELKKAIQIFNPDIIKPDITFLLYVEESERERRILESRKSLSKSDELSLTDKCYLKKALTKYDALSKRNDWVKIDNTSLEVENAVNQALIAYYKVTR